MNKPFLTFQEQLNRLESKGISCLSTDEKKMLIKKGYFNLVNGYKKPFILKKLSDGTHVYHEGTSIKQFSQVFSFDRRLRDILLKNITHVEEELRNMSAYFFDLNNELEDDNWYHTSGYDSKIDEDKVVKLINDIKDEIEKAKNSNNGYINHYALKDFEIPTWVMIKVIKLTTFSKFLELTKKSVKIELCKLYDIENNSDINDFKILFSAINWIRKTRNACAHNERIIFIKDDNKAVVTKYHNKLTNSYKARTREKQIIDLLIFLKYFNTKKDYNKLIKQIIVELEQLKNVVGEIVFEKIRAGMGIRNLEHLLILQNEPKIIEYTKLI